MAVLALASLVAQSKRIALLLKLTPLVYLRSTNLAREEEHGSKPHKCWCRLSVTCSALRDPVACGTMNIRCSPSKYAEQRRNQIKSATLAVRGYSSAGEVMNVASKRLSSTLRRCEADVTSFTFSDGNVR